MSTPHVVRFERGLQRIAGRCWCSVHLSCSSPAALFHATDWSPQQFHADGQARPSIDPVQYTMGSFFNVNTASGAGGWTRQREIPYDMWQHLESIVGPLCRVAPFISPTLKPKPLGRSRCSKPLCSPNGRSWIGWRGSVPSAYCDVPSVSRVARRLALACQSSYSRLAAPSAVRSVRPSSSRPRSRRSTHDLAYVNSKVWPYAS